MRCSYVKEAEAKLALTIIVLERPVITSLIVYVPQITTRCHEARRQCKRVRGSSTSRNSAIVLCRQTQEPALPVKESYLGKLIEMLEGEVKRGCKAFLSSYSCLLRKIVAELLTDLEKFEYPMVKYVG